jgi:uncharacterized protein (DUF1800 family)
MNAPSRSPAVLAAFRFGLAESDPSVLRGDPRGWVQAQWRAPAVPDAGGLADGATALGLTRRVIAAATTAPAVPGAGAMPGAMAGDPAGDGAMAAPAPAASAGGRPDARPDPDRRRLREANLQALQRRWAHWVHTPTPVAERWVQFWANHFAVAATKGATLGLVWPFEREAVRPHAFGNLRALVRASTLHPAMLLYLDNAQSVGPGSRAGRRRARGLNENLARELLELHTLGVSGGYGQADVTQAARLLTGWTVPRDEPSGTTGRFVLALHEPGPKQILGRRFEEGPEALDALIDHLVRHPATQRHLATKLVRHFVADEPPPPVVEAVAARLRDTDGELAEAARALFEHPLTWASTAAPKFRAPEDWMLAAHRLLGQTPRATERLAAELAAMGQPPGRAPSPQGWPDRREDWLSPDALWKRVEWAAAFARRAGTSVDARAVARQAFGDALRPATAQEVERAESGPQALALLLASSDLMYR